MRDLQIEGNGTPCVVATNSKSLTVGSASSHVKLSAPAGLQLPLSSPVEGTAATTVASSGTIDTTVGWARITNAGAITGVILAAGTRHGQLCVVTVDKDASGTVTFAAAGTSRVGTGTACVIAVGAGRIFIWDNTDLIWCELGET